MPDQSKKKKRNRLSIMDGAGLMLFAAMVLALRMAAELYIGGVSGDIVVCGGYSFLCVLALRGVRKKKRANLIRLYMPTIAQVILATLCALTAVFMADDIKLIIGTLLQNRGFDVSGYIYPAQTMTVYALLSHLVLGALIPAIAQGIFFHGILLSTWERRSTRIAILISSLFSALFCGSVIEFIPMLMISFAVGCVTAASGSLPLGLFMRCLYAALPVYARYVGAGRTAVSAVRYDALWVAVGRSSGMLWLLMEAVLLIGAFFLLMRAACLAKGTETAAIRLKPERIKGMSPSCFFVYSAAAASALLCMCCDLLNMAGMI